MSSLTFCHQVILQFLIAAISLLLIAKSWNLHQLHKLYGLIFYGLTRMLALNPLRGVGGELGG